MISIESLNMLMVQTKTRIKAGESISGLRNEILGRQGTLASMLKQLAMIDPKIRSTIGAHANGIKRELEKMLSESVIEPRIDVDLTVPIQARAHGHEHPVPHMIAELYTIFGNLGFSRFETPEIESEEHNFDALLVPKDHPARDMQDTFWTTSGAVLRTHTTAFQKRAISGLKPPFAVMQGGKIYRAEAEDATHLAEFHHFDCFAVAPGLTFGDLRGLLFEAMRQLFGETTDIRFRPAYFPFVEPGAELDIKCPHCHGIGCRACASKGWLEVLGCGMTHPDIFKNVGLDPNQYQGLAWGMGVERLVMLKYQINDIRDLTKNNPRFLEQLI